MLTFKVGAKGGVSVYGLGRFPVTLYASQWEQLLEDGTVRDLLLFIDMNRDQLKQRHGSVAGAFTYHGAGDYTKD